MLAERANVGLHDHLIDKVQDLTDDKTIRIFDIGCGSGAFLRRLADLGYTDLTGLDIEPPALTGVKCIRADLDEFDVTDECPRVDLITAIEVVEHVENLGHFLSSASKLLKPNGLMLLTTPNLHSVEARLRFLASGNLKQFDEIGDPTHIAPIFRIPFKRALMRHQFIVEKEWGFPLDGSSPTSRPVLRLLARIVSRLGVPEVLAGDNLIILAQKSLDPWSQEQKRRSIISHY